MGQSENLLFQSELHPLVSQSPKSRGEFVLSLVHSKAYARAAELARGGVTLDLGCNDGYGTQLLAAQSSRVVGVDVSQGAIQTAQEVRQGNNIEFRLIDGAALPFADETFDLVVSFQVIEHVVAVAPYLSEIRRVLKPGGRVLFTTPNRMIRLDPGMKPWNSFHVHEYTGEELGNTLRQVFPNTTVKGLMAAKELYDIEYARCQSALAATRAKAANASSATSQTPKAQGFNFADAIKAMLPQFAIDALRRSRDARQERQKPESERPLNDAFARRWSIADMFYVEDRGEVDRSLDLMAECQR